MRLFLLIICSLFPLGAQAADRIALVVGMSQYVAVDKLRNTVNDARGVSATLEGIGFEVTTLLDVTGDEFRAAIDDFSFQAETSDLALIYFAGHGVEVQGENFLIPVDAKVASNRDIQDQSVSLKDLLAAVDRARKMRIVILDSCRNNPFKDALDIAALNETAKAATGTRSASGGGLAPPSPDRGTLVAFAARDGEKALDGNGANSPFAQALMVSLPKPGLEIGLLFREVRDSVLVATQNLQEPHTYGSLPGTPFYIAGPGTDNSLVESDLLQVAWSDIKPDQELQLVSLADQGDSRSMIGLAYMRLNTEDSRYAPGDAVKLFTRAANTGSAEAQFELGQLYEMGVGVAQDIPRAMALYQQAADQDYPDALNDLGIILFQGNMGLPQDTGKALAYFERAADLRHPQAMYNLAGMIDEGKIAGKGPQDAARYLYVSLRSGSARVHDLLRDRPEVFKEATRRALQAKLAENGLYSGALDGSFGPGTKRAISSAFGLKE